MTAERVAVVEHHGLEKIPQFFEGKAIKDVEGIAGYIVWELTMTTGDYPFLWDAHNQKMFKEAVVAAGTAYLTGNLEVLDESQKSEDVICQACKNLIEGKCKYEESDVF